MIVRRHLGVLPVERLIALFGVVLPLHPQVDLLRLLELPSENGKLLAVGVFRHIPQVDALERVPAHLASITFDLDRKVVHRVELDAEQNAQFDRIEVGEHIVEVLIGLVDLCHEFGEGGLDLFVLPKLLEVDVHFGRALIEEGLVGLAEFLSGIFARTGVEEEEAHLAAAHAFEIIVLFARAGHGGVERFADDGDDPRIIPVLKVVAQPMDEVFKLHAFFFELDDGRADKNADLFLCHDVPPL